MFAVAMNGVPLPLAHGFPIRMIVSGLDGYVSATKWLSTSMSPGLPTSRPTGRPVVGPSKRRSRPRPASTFRNRSPASRPATLLWQVSPGPDNAASLKSKSAWMLALGRPQNSLLRIPSIPGGNGCGPGRTLPAGNNTLQVRATDATSTVQRLAVSRHAPMGPADGTASR